MINIPAPGMVDVGSPATEQGRDTGETLRAVSSESSFASRQAIGIEQADDDDEPVPQSRSR